MNVCVYYHYLNGIAAIPISSEPGLTFCVVINAEYLLNLLLLLKHDDNLGACVYIC